MNDEMLLLLKLMLAQAEEEKNGGQRVPLDTAVNCGPMARTQQNNGIQKQYLEQDVTAEIRESFQEHSMALPNRREIPTWEKYALTVAEAAQYFHIGITRLRELINHDKYADYLIWNGKRVFIKRKMFEEFLNKTNSI